MSNRDAFLTAVSRCEGTDGLDGYRALFGYTPARNAPVFDGYVDHPNIRMTFKQTDGQQKITTAAGRYQINYPTWRNLKMRYGYVDFTPATQDDAALRLIEEHGALADVDAGNFLSAIDKCAACWASLPASMYPQPTRTLQFALNAYTSAGGQVA